MPEQGGLAKQIARWTALTALFLIPLAPLIVPNAFFFPFITGKAFFFRIVVEVLVAAWVVLACLDREYRPRFSWAGVAVIAFVAWMLVADLFAVNVAKAFWSNFERMEGWVLLIHLLGLFFAASAVLRVERKWRLWFMASLAVSLIVAGHALLQLAGTLPIHQGSTRIDASFGNSAYLAIYLLFNVFIAGWLALSEEREWLKWSLIALAVLEGVLIFFTETRGTILGLVGGLALAALLTAFTAGKRARSYAAGALIALLVLAGGFYLARDSSFVKNNDILNRVASISLADGQVRFTIWGIAWDGFVQSPKTMIVGWGQEGFNYVFNKYYNPTLYQQEAWFDRAHNAFIDWLIAGGFPAFALYLALFGVAIWLLWTRSELSRAERIALTCALAGYACHNLFVFDNLYSYIYFFAILALIDSQVSRPVAWINKWRELSSAEGLSYALPVAAALALVAVWFVNVPGMAAAAELVAALSPAPDPSDNLAIFQDVAKHPAFAAQEVREQLVSFAASLAQDSSASTTLQAAASTLAINEMSKQVASYPQDARERLELAYAYDAAGDDTDALTQIKDALALSPDKESMWLQAGLTEWNLGDATDAQADFAKAYALGPEFTDLAAYAAAGDYGMGDTADGDKILLAAYGTTTVDSDVLATAYFGSRDWTRLIALWKLRVSEPTAGAQQMFGLAAAYYAAGDNAQAIAELQATAAKYPDAASSVQAAIQQVEAGTGK